MDEHANPSITSHHRIMLALITPLPLEDGLQVTNDNDSQHKHTRTHTHTPHTDTLTYAHTHILTDSQAQTHISVHNIALNQKMVIWPILLLQTMFCLIYSFNSTHRIVTSIARKSGADVLPWRHERYARYL